jgi:hypothetical protein
MKMTTTMTTYRNATTLAVLITLNRRIRNIGCLPS